MLYCGLVIIMVDFIVRSIKQHILPPNNDPSTGISNLKINFPVLHSYLTTFQGKMCDNSKKLFIFSLSSHI